jgi:hypothetical protein
MPLGGSVPTVAGLANQVAAEWEDALRARLVAVEKTSAGLAATARIVDESESSAIALIERIAREGDAL